MNWGEAVIINAPVGVHDVFLRIPDIKIPRYRACGVGGAELVPGSPVQPAGTSHC